MYGLAEDLNNLQLVIGRVKWFDPVKGFGFIVADEGGPDILLHINVLRNFGQNSVADDARIEVFTHVTDRGVQASEIVNITPPDRDENAGLRDLAELVTEDLDTIELEAGRVKWFDKVKGFGFANVFGKPEDVFLHIEVLRLSGVAAVQPGEALALRVIEGKRGRMAAQVLQWEMGLHEDGLI